MDIKAESGSSALEKERARLQEQTTALNEALMLSSVRQHELTQAAERLNEKLKAEMAKREQVESAHAMLAAIVESSDDAIFSKDFEGIINSWNRGAERLFGYTAEEAIGQPGGMLIPAERADEESDILERVRRGERVENYETLRRRKDGESRNVSLTVSPITDASGRIVGASKIVRDVTLRIRAEEALRRTETRYRSLFESIDEGFCVLEKVEGEAGEPLDFLHVEANPAVEKHSGMAGVLGKTMRQISPRVSEDWYETFADVLATGEPLRFERPGAVDGHQLELFAFRVEDGSNRRVAVIFKDITERRRAESKLSKAMVAAEQANLAKSDFLSSMSHELRTPLNAILGFAQLIEAGSPSPTPAQTRSIDQILKAGWYLLELINEILDLSAVESGRLMLAKESVPLAEVMVECRAIVETQAQKRGIGVTFHGFEVPWHVKGDRIRIKQVLVNLLSNAIKYNQSEGKVSVEYALISPDSIRIDVRDTGGGLTPEQLGQLFQPFNRLGQEAGAEGGTGTGLVVTKRLVELMGGTIGAKSTVGVGSVFWIQLSLAAAPPPVVHEAAHAAPARPLLPDGTPLRTLLHVEDNPASLELVEQLIARRPELRLLSAADASLGIEYARAHQPEVILMDLNLPGISGIEALKILRADPSTAGIPVVALSANAMSGDIERALKAGFLDYITKPIKIEQFMGALDAALAFSITASGQAAQKRQAP